MWFEVLPTFGIIVTLMYAPTVSWYILHKLAYDNAYTRKVDDTSDFMMFYLRDQRITGKGWKTRTLREAVELDDE
ncbi:UNVERIFIED_CONTAM: hypothetical protein RMT77_011167 [Armadillidium vulgare]